LPFHIILIDVSNKVFSVFDGKKATNHIKTCIINPKRSSNFAKAIGNRSKTDKVDAKTLYAFKTLLIQVI